MIRFILICLTSLMLTPLLTAKELTINEAKALVKQGSAKVITKKELHEIKKRNIRIEITELNINKKKISKIKKDEVLRLESKRKAELAKLNAKFDSKRVNIENKRNKEIADVLKMVTIKQSEIKMIDRLEEIAKKARFAKKQQMKLVTLKSQRAIKDHYKTYKHISNVILQISMLDAFELYLTSLQKNYNHSVVVKIKSYLLRLVEKENDIDYDVFEEHIEKSSVYELNKLFKILQESRGQ